MQEVNDKVLEKKTLLISKRLNDLRTLKKKQKWKLRSRLLKYTDVIITMREFENSSYQEIADYLRRYHKIKVHRSRVHAFYQRITRDLPPSVNDESFWGEAGEI